MRFTIGRTIFLLAASALFLGAQPVDQMKELARIATGMVDGDLCQRIVTARAMKSILTTDPRDKWAAHDNYDVHHEAFIRTRKTLIRLSRLVKFPCDVNLWMPIPAKEPAIHVVVRTGHEMSQFWVFGKLTQKMFPEMKQVLETGEQVVVRKKPGWVSVLAPVRNSLDDIVGLVEVVSPAAYSPHANVY